MSTIDYINSRQNGDAQLPDGQGLRIAIAVANWNSNITYKLLDGAVSYLERCGVEGIDVMYVPGAFELTNAAARLKHDSEDYDAIIVIGCVVRGDTPHFDYVCQGVTAGISRLNTMHGQTRPHLGSVITPVIFCVLTTDTMEQAEARAGGVLGNKGKEAAEAALLMVHPRFERLK